jgi:hypothetical protein
VGNDQPRLVTGGGVPGGSAEPGEDSEPAEGSGPGYLVELMGGFRATGDGATARFGAAQAAILRELVGEVAELIAGPAPDQGDLPGRMPGERAGQPGDDPEEPDDLAALMGLTENPQLPDDPVLARLLPDAYRDDPEASAEFRRYTEGGLRSEKAAAARTVLATLPPSGGRVRLSGPEAEAWLRALNDVRLALGTRLDVTEDPDEQAAGLEPDDPRAAALAVYQWLGILQESLIEALS